MDETGAKQGGRFKKGQTGNPRGRPKIPAEFKAKCREATDKHVFDAWREEVVNRGEHWPKAAEMLAAYGYGKPSQPLTGEGGEGPVVVEILKESNHAQ